LFSVEKGVFVKFFEYVPGVTLAQYIENQKSAKAAEKSDSPWSPDSKFISTAIEVVRQLLETVRLKADIFRFEFFCFLVR
jgi:hypothetical protein